MFLICFSLDAFINETTINSENYKSEAEIGFTGSEFINPDLKIPTHNFYEADHHLPQVGENIRKDSRLKFIGFAILSLTWLLKKNH
ncbi:hypothetical protein [Lactococcus garvieae]|uniref:hypothetical protein n=1 Tax=Lactococcus garvieae TaxID=1363 RepID=UPI003853EF39